MMLHQMQGYFLPNDMKRMVIQDELIETWKKESWGLSRHDCIIFQDRLKKIHNSLHPAITVCATAKM